MRLILTVICMLCSLSTFAEEPVHKLNVSGSSLLFKKPDLLSLKIGVISQSTTVEEAMSGNRGKTENVVLALKKAGLTEKEFQTGTFTITPQYTPTPKNPPPDWSPSIIAYRVQNSLSIRTQNLSLASSMIDAATKAGANLIEDLSFSLANPNQAQSEAIAQAVIQARALATAAANEAGVNLGPVLELSIHPAYAAPRMMKIEFANQAGGSETPIVPGDIEVTASLSLVYKIIP